MIRRLLTVLALVVTGLVASAPSAAATQDSTAIAVNTKDGASIFRLSFQVRRVVDDVVDAGNAAVAAASCTDCTTVALAFQVVLVMGDPEVVTPTNVALAYNEECSACVTYAAATQLVFGTGERLKLSTAGTHRLNELRKHLRSLADQELTVDQLDAEVAAARAELRSILETELEPVGRDDRSPPSDAAASTTTTTGGVTTTTGPASTATTTSPPRTTSTTTGGTGSTTSSPSTTAPTSTTSSTTTSTTVAG